jgi:hypothetical protein
VDGGLESFGVLSKEIHGMFQGISQKVNLYQSGFASEGFG